MEEFYIFLGGFFKNICHWSVFYSLGMGGFGRAEVAEESRTNVRCVSVRWWPPDGSSRASLPTFQGSITGAVLAPTDAVLILPLAGAPLVGVACVNL